MPSPPVDTMVQNEGDLYPAEHKIGSHPWRQREGPRKRAGASVKRHPRRTCILASFLCAIIFSTVGFVVAGFELDRPLLGPLFVAAVLPSLFILYVAYHKELAADDKYARGVCAACSEGHEDKVPLEVLVLGFVFGILVTIPVGVFGGLIQVGGESFMKSQSPISPVLLMFYVFLEAFVFTAVVEEGAKYLCTTYAIDRDSFHEYVTHPYGVVLFGLAAALGFAALENVTYVMGEKTDSASWALAVVRALLAVPLHGTTGALIGVGLARRRFLGDQTQTILRILVLPVLIHGLYDFVWMAPLRNGPFDEKQPAHGLHNADNTIDVGGFLLVIYFANVLMVFVAASYATKLGRQLRDDYASTLDVSAV